MSSSARRLRRKWWGDLLKGKVVRFQEGHVVCADALTVLNELPAHCADVLFLDPPFNLGKVYGCKNSRGDRIPDEEYFSYISSIIARGTTVLKDGGAMYLYHVPRWALRFADVMERQLQFRHWIAVSMKNGFARGNRLYPAHYALLYYTKGDPAHFCRPKVAVQKCRHCAKPIRDYGGYKRFVTQGLNLSDVWDDISPVRHSKYKNRDSNELPAEICRRVVAMSGCSGGVFVDPFAGSGTSLVVAFEEGMRFVGADLVPEYCQLICQRLRQAKRSCR